MTKKKTIGNVPNLRFPGFEGEWDESVLGNVCAMKAGKFIIASDIFEEFEEKLFPCYGGNGLRGYVSSFNKDGLFSLIGRQGALCGNVNLVSGKVYATEHAVVVSPEQNIDTIWLYHLLNYLNLNQYATGAAQPGLSVQNLEKVEVKIPKSKLEQVKISSFLYLLDQRIDTQSKIIEQLKSLIAGLRDSIFLQKMKFSSSQSDWKSFKVSDLLEFFPTNSLSWDNLEYNTDGYYNLHYGIIHKGNSNRLDLSNHILPNIKSEFDSDKFSLCKNGDIAFADASEDTNDIGKPIEFVNCDDKKVVCGLHTIHGRDKLNLTFVGFKGFAFSSSKFRDQIRRLGQGTKVYSISEKNFKDCSIDIPSMNEQVKITQILTLIDEKITVEMKILRKLNAQKTSLLKNLFI